MPSNEVEDLQAEINVINYLFKHENKEYVYKPKYKLSEYDLKAYDKNKNLTNIEVKNQKSKNYIIIEYCQIYKGTTNKVPSGINLTTADFWYVINNYNDLYIIKTEKITEHFDYALEYKERYIEWSELDQNEISSYDWIKEKYNKDYLINGIPEYYFDSNNVQKFKDGTFSANKGFYFGIHKSFFDTQKTITKALLKSSNSITKDLNLYTYSGYQPIFDFKNTDLNEYDIWYPDNIILQSKTTPTMLDVYKKTGGNNLMDKLNNPFRI